MTKKALSMFALLIIYAGAFAKPALACGCNCSFQRVDDEFTCGEGQNCQYDQITSVCAPAGCRECIEDCGSGMCNCGDQIYYSDCLVTCGAAPTGARNLDVDDPNVLRAQLAAPDCSGKFRLLKLRRARRHSSVSAPNSLEDKLR